MPSQPTAGPGDHGAETGDAVATRSPGGRAGEAAMTATGTAPTPLPTAPGWTVPE